MSHTVDLIYLLMTNSETRASKSRDYQTKYGEGNERFRNQ